LWDRNERVTSWGQKVKGQGMVVGIGKYEHITPVLRDTLHWLRVTARIQFRIAALTFDCVQGTGPVYLKQVIRPVSDLSRRSLRRLTAVSCSFRGQTCPSASEVSPSRLLSSGTHFHLTSAHRSTVADSSDQRWKPIFSDKPITLHDSSENNSLKCVTVTVTVTRSWWNKVCWKQHFLVNTMSWKVLVRFSRNLHQWCITGQRWMR